VTESFTRRAWLTGSLASIAAFSCIAAPLRAALPVLPKKNDGTWSAHPLWSILRETKLKVDDNGIIHAAFVPQVLQLSGKPMTITGFVMPVGGDARHHFVLSRYSPECPFCPAGGPTETIEVFADQPVGATQLMVTIEGVFNVQGNMDAGLFYRLFHAKPIP
jgi:hypothetical protein